MVLKVLSDSEFNVEILEVIILKFNDKMYDVFKE